MGKPIEGVDWSKVQIEYMTGQLNCTELAYKYNISAQAIAKRCSREKWKDQRNRAVQKVSERTVERVVDRKMAMIEEMEAEVVPIARKLTRAVELSHDSMHGEAIDSAHLNGLAQALAKANAVCRLNLGAVDPQQRVDVTTNGESLGARALQMMDACRKLKEQGKLPDPSTIDIEALVREGEEERKRLENGGE